MITNSPPLVRSVVHPTDFSPASEQAFAYALAVAVLRGTILTILHVGRAHDWDGFPAVRGTLERWGLLPPGSDRAAVFDEFGVQVEKVILSSRFPTFAIDRHLSSSSCDLLVLATEGRRGAARWLKSSTAEAVARSSKTMTLFVPADAERHFVSIDNGDLSLKNVLVPVDREPSPIAAVEFARRMAEAIGSDDVTLTLLHVGEDEGPDIATSDAEGCRFRRERRNGEPVEQILAVAKEQAADLIVMATAGRHGVLEALRGSTTERVLREADCPVLAVPGRG